MQNVILAWTHAVHTYTERKPLRRISLFFVFLLLTLTTLSIYAGSAGAAPNTNINFQARILSNSGAVVGDGFYTVEFNIYALSSGGATQWTETQVVTSKNGYLSVSLGSVTPFGSSIDWSQEQWLSMNINGDGEMNPRMKITAVPFALRAKQADTLTTPTGSISADQLAQISPGLVQSVNSANTAIRINQIGSGSLLQLQGNGTDALTLSNTGDLTIAKGLTVGNSTNTVAGTIRWNGAAFEGYNGAAWAPIGGSVLANPIINKVKLVNETQNNTVNATATLQNDDELFFAIGANETWTFRYMIQANANATPDIKFAVTAPGGAVCRVSTADHEAAVSVANLGCGVSTGLVTGNTTNDLYEVIGTVTNGATAGNVTLQWAQNTANAANSIIYAGSSVLATRAVGANGSAQAFIQNGNSFGATAVLGTNDNNNLNVTTNGLTRLTVQSDGNVGIGDTTPAALFTVGANDALQVNASGDLQTTGTLSIGGLATVSGNIVGSGLATGTVGTTTGTGASTTTITLIGDSFNVNDVIYINNVGQDYYTRVITDPGTGSYTVSPAVTFETGRTVTKYTVQNIGATSTDYSSQANRFFQGYFLGGLVIGAGSTTISDGSISSTTALRLQENGGDLLIGGALNVEGTITGDASGLTNIDASQITGGSVSDTKLSANVTLLGNTFNGANQLLQLTASGELPGLSGVSITNINANNISSGTLDDARLSSNVTLLGNVFNGSSQLVQLNAAGELPALSAVGLTSLNATNISSGTLADARLSSNVTLLGNTFNGANQLIQLDGTGALPALSGAGLTLLNASNISSGTLADARLSSNVTLLGNTFNGANQLVQLDGSAKIADSLLTNNITAAGNTFNGANQLLQLNGSGALPILNAAGLTSLNATNLASGTVNNSLLSSTVTLAGNTFNGANQLLQLNGSGALPTIDGSALITLNATNISSGTVADGRLSNNVGLLNISQSYTAQQTFASSLILGTDSASPTAGLLALNDATGSNGFTNVLGTSSLTANRNITLPDANGTVCLSGSTACGFILLAPGTAQVDSSTNSSLFINKTSASGDLLTLQKNGTTILRMLNNGALQLQLDNTAAFSVKNAGGTDLFNIDTVAGLVRIGGAVADGSGTLLVLDTKNTAGDPAGVEGASYFNSVSNKMRCYEDGYWSDCATTRAQADVTLTTAANNISLTLPSDGSNLQCYIKAPGLSAVSRVDMRLNNVSAANSYGYNVLQNLTGANNNTSTTSSAGATEVRLTGSGTSTGSFSANVNISNFSGSPKAIDWTGTTAPTTGMPANFKGGGVYYSTTGFITSVQFITSAGNFNIGTRAWCEAR